MNAESAWQAATGQLQMEMSKASFETWVRSTEVVKYQEHTFTIGVQNAFARDWLEKRLTSTVERLLGGLMDGPQKVEFIVHHKDYKPKNSRVKLPLKHR
jgi:chromosomal replication initiator protein